MRPAGPSVLRLLVAVQGEEELRDAMSATPSPRRGGRAGASRPWSLQRLGHGQSWDRRRHGGSAGPQPTQGTTVPRGEKGCTPGIPSRR
jgi:hypothetical protein